MRRRPTPKHHLQDSPFCEQCHRYVGCLIGGTYSVSSGYVSDAVRVEVLRFLFCQFNGSETKETEQFSTSNLSKSKRLHVHRKSMLSFILIS
jgi:hypothetical protein